MEHLYNTDSIGAGASDVGADSLSSNSPARIHRGPGRYSQKMLCTTNRQVHLTVYCSPYCLPHAYKLTVKKEIADLLEYSIIEHFTREWSTPIKRVKKADSTMSFGVDNAQLYGISEANHIKELIIRLEPAKYITTLDFT